jgi:hypothetical protein
MKKLKKNTKISFFWLKILWFVFAASFVDTRYTKNMILFMLDVLIMAFLIKKGSKYQLIALRFHEF